MRPLPVLLLAALLAPAVGAEHVYSHRFVLEGRLVGSDGAPLPGRTVEFFSDDPRFDEPCQEPSQPVTDAFGDFRFCFHVHDLDSRSEVGVRSGNASVVKPMDTAFRKSVVVLTEPNETGVASEDWNVTHLVAGRVWRNGPRELEGVRVFGSTVDRVPVNVTMSTPDGTRSAFQVETDGYGDFRASLRLVDPVPPENVTVEMEVLGHRQTRTLDAFSHRLTVGFILPPERPEDAPAVAFPQERAAPPGSATGPVGVGLVLAVALGLGAALLLARRKP